SLYRYADPTHRHAFPTRRSSDLPPPDSRKANILHQNAGFLPGRSVDRLLRQLAGGFCDQPCGRFAQRYESLAGKAMEVSSLREEDRKSTRLNSSHEWISYAVFCV